MELTPEQTAAAKLLVEEHHDLQLQLLELNRILDDQLSRRGQGLSRVQPIQRATDAQTEKLALHNERQRRINDELMRHLIMVDSLAKTDDLRQRSQLLATQLDRLRDENKSLENIFANQQVQTSVADKIEADMRKAKDEHHDEVMKLKDATRHLKEEREQDVEQLRHLQRNEARLELRLKVQADVSSTASAEELESLNSTKERELESLRNQIMALSKASSSKARASRKMDKVSRELDELRGEAQLLREKLEAVRIHEEF